jgi:hypothetical protein
MDPELKRTARNEQFYYLNYLTVEEIYAWMIEELWTAITTFDRDKAPDNDLETALKGYWWECWKNRRNKLISHRYTDTYRINRAGLQNEHVEVVAHQEERIPECPVPGLLEWRVWQMLASSHVRIDQTGRRNRKDWEELQSDICRELGITPGLFYEILESFRNSMVRDHLSDGM